MGQVLERPINFLNFPVLWVGPPPNQSLPSPGGTDRPLWSRASPAATLTCMAHVPPSLVPPSAWYWKGGTQGFSTDPINFLALVAWGVSIHLSSFHALSEEPSLPSQGCPASLPSGPVCLWRSPAARPTATSTGEAVPAAQSISQGSRHLCASSCTAEVPPPAETLGSTLPPPPGRGATILPAAWHRLQVSGASLAEKGQPRVGARPPAKRVLCVTARKPF